MRRTSKLLIVVVTTIAALGLGWTLGRGDRPLCPPALQRLVAPEQLAPPSPVVHAAAGSAALIFVGDVLPIEDRDYLTAVAPLIRSADYAVCNLECPLSERGTRTPLKLNPRGGVIPNEYFFQAPPSQAQRLANTGFDAVVVANNHIMDYGPQALLETFSALDDAGIEHTGAGPDLAAARQPVVARIGAQTIALLSYVSVRTLPGTEHFAATERTAGTVFVAGDASGNPTAHTAAMIANDIRAARKVADFVVPCFHWGIENRDSPDALPRRLARHAIDSGAAMVIGHHPHVLQGVEIYRGAPICYSLGNFVFPTPHVNTTFSAALEVQLEAGRWREMAFHPVRLKVGAGDPIPAAGNDRRRIIDRLTRLSAAFGTTAMVVEDGDGTRVVVRNSEQPRERSELLVVERESFYVSAHESLDGMSVVSFLAWGLDGEEKAARRLEVVVNDALAGEVMSILREIYLDPDRFPIHEVIGYDYRTIAGGGGRMSWHAAGRAIDINRAQNPMIRDGQYTVHPDEPPYEPKQWRPGEDPLSITADGSVVRAFKRHGWRWGGDWTSSKDYQHFDKPR
ncbi:MAG: hypothetical protein GX131_02695 [candidate division WS1 bacterium]|nr:hypothetical protein [candidate division WS1 bacterium]